MPSPLTPAQSSALKRIADTAVRICERRYGVPAEMPVAQACDETGYGNAAPHDNWFGIKPHGQTETQTFQTHERSDMAGPAEAVAFAAYPGMDAAFEDYAILITTSKNYKPYLDRFHQNENLDALIAGVSGKWAEDVLYARKLGKILSRSDVQAAITAARAAV